MPPNFGGKVDTLINYLLTIQIKTWFQNFRHKQKKQNQVIKQAYVN